MVSRKLRCVSPRYGNYVGLTIPKYIVEELRLHAGDEVNVKLAGKSIIVTPANAVLADQAIAEAETPTTYGGIDD